MKPANKPLTNGWASTVVIQPPALLIVTLLFLGSLGTHAHATLNSRPLPIDAIEEQLAKVKKDTTATQLEESWNAFKAGKFARARTLALKHRESGEFQDFARWILAESALSEARARLAKSSAAEIMSWVTRIRNETPEIPLKNPYTSLQGRATALYGFSETLEATTLLRASGRKKKARTAGATRALPLWERGLKRVADGGALGQLTVYELEALAETCSLKPSELCYEWLQSLALSYPKGSRELRTIGKFYPDVLDTQRARAPYFGKLVQTYRGPELDQAAFDPALKHALDGEWKSAATSFEQFIDEFPKSSLKTRAAYWLAQSAARTGNDERAQRIFTNLHQESPLTYYGLLAALAARSEPDSAIAGELPLAASHDSSLSPGEIAQLRRAEILIRSGAPRLAAFELAAIKPRTSLTSPFLLYLALLQSKAFAYRASFVTLSELIARGYERIYSSFVVRLVFPLPYEELIEKYSKQNDLDPMIVLSLIKQESAFDEQAISSSGALGLMQLMPTTALDVDPNVLRSELLDPETNIRIGTAYLKRVLNRFKGNLVLALAGYNAGPTAADRWFKAPTAPKNVTEFVETIPYRETREYVSSILRNYFWYSRKLKGEFPPNLDYFWNLYGPPQKPNDKLKK